LRNHSGEKRCDRRQEKAEDFVHQLVESKTDKVDRLFAEWDRPDSPGCALGIIKDGQFVYKRGYGMATLEHDVPITSQTVFRIASTSKQFTAVCIALLVEQDRIALDDDVRKYLPELPEYGYPITIRHLVHHTSGLRDYIELMELAGMRDQDFYTDDEVLEVLARQKALNFAPGEEYLYSNTGYYLLGIIVSRVSGQSLRTFAEENVFRPLGMASTHFHDDHAEIVPQRATGYSPNKEKEKGGYRIDETTLDIVGDGSVFTTIEDLSLWDQNFYRNRLGQGGDALIQQILTSGTLNNGNPLNYAFGLVAGDYKGLEMISHGGGFVGFRAEMIRFPEQKLSVICLANLSTIEPTRLARQVADIYLADQIEEEPGTGFLAETRFLDDKAGVYWSGTSGMVMELSLQNGKLLVEVFSESAQVAPITETDFVTVASPFDMRIRFEKPGRGKPWLMHVCDEDERPDTLEMIEVVSPGTDQLAEYVGEYASEELRVTYQIVLEDGNLFVRHRSAPKDPLKPGFSDMFWVDRITLLFTRDDRARVSGFTVNTGRVRQVRFVRVR
jgi:CubicO group peptidase (beta-lactamase class C family)